ncbi:hypothetical protein PDQ75_27230 [Bacillus cereus group sp. Bc015]|uniref:hypothetical protein n=1 Tax=Bacillus cereus group sp. Bc015 TaxID=3018123 RepID=UPI0022E28CAE|nr:hypothetical protein [Bacillus cereus group sp. Bc015]MDA2738831.1 hypothetical protein [Bacillus cereus group sp. Bc015]
MFQRISKLYRDLLKQNIKLHDENSALKIQNALLRKKLAESDSFLYDLQRQVEREIMR